jgi:peroxiredoxin
MKRKGLLLAALLAVVTFFTSSAISNAESVFPIGSKLDNFTMPDPNGKDHSYNDLKGEKGALIIFLSAQCPVVKMYDERINEIAAAYQTKGINFIGIYPNYTESVEWVRSHSEEKYKFPVLIDKDNVFADKLGATRTPEVYYFNEKDILDYHGAIDNDRSGNNISKTYLKSAFDQKLSGKEITEKETNAFGCSIKRVEKADEGAK